MGERHALLVATARYADPRLRTLRAPVDETQVLSQLLQDKRIGEFDSAPVLIDNRKSVIEYEIEKLFSDRQPDDLVLLYLSGHGMVVHGQNAKRLFFAAYDTDMAKPFATAISASLVHQMLDQCQAGNKVIILDCCNSGLFSSASRTKSVESVKVDADFGKGTFVMTAGRELDLAFEDEKLVFDRQQPYSLFTDALITGIKTGAAARVGADHITADDLYEFALREVRKRNTADRVQVPERLNHAHGTVRIANVWSRKMVVDESAESPKLAELLPEPAAAPAQELVVPIGKLHTSTGAADDVVRLKLAGHDGHLGIIGKIFSGKSTLLRTLIAGIQAGQSADDVHFYFLDSGGAFNDLRRSPHVRAVVGPSDHQDVLDVLTRVGEIVTDREKLFRRANIGSVDTFRVLRRRGTLEPGDHGEVFLVIDGWDQFEEELPQIVHTVRRIASAGLSKGVHVLVAARHWAEIPTEISRLLRTRIELALDDPAESKFGPHLSAALPNRAGWGLIDGKPFLAAVAEVADVEEDADQAEEVLVSSALADEEAPTAPVRPPTVHPFDTNPRLLSLAGLPDDPMAFDIQRAWRPRPVRERYRVPFGIDESGRPLTLDLKESALEGMGPHGLCIGAVGSGKSELLRTIVLGLAMTHSSTALNFVLVDFKGGATFLGMDALPHVAATITNLQSDLSLVDRMKDALAGEVNRRQEVLRRSGNFTNVWEYEKARENGADLDPLPALFIVVDEFSELLSAKPDFIDEFVAIGRVGRSLQMHLLLASQRLEEGKLRGLDSYMSYRIGMRTFSAAESRAAIGVPDAYELPSIPGFGYLRSDANAIVRFKAAYVSGPARAQAEDEPWEQRPSTLDVVVERIVGQGPPAHELWLPPLGESNPLDALLPPLRSTEDRGLSPAGSFNGRLQVPLGIIDKPFEQRRDLLWADFSGAAGHGAVVGGPQSGKSMALRTLILSMALANTPEEVQFYCLDFGGGTLGTIEGLPHVGGVATRGHPDKARRVVDELTTLLAQRERRFREVQIDSMPDFRDRKRRGEIKEDPFGDVFLIVDGWLTFRQEFETLEAQVVNLAARGLSYGIHVIVAATRWAEIRPSLRDLLGTRFELRLGDPSESDVDRRAALNVPRGRPGRGLTADKQHFLIGLPRIDGSTDPNVADGLRSAIARIDELWHGRKAPKVRLLPELVSYAELPRRVDTKLVPIGVDENELAPVYLDFDAEPHFMAFAEGESGKTNLIRAIARGITDRYTPQEALIILVDYRRTMLGFIDDDHQLAYAVSSKQLDDMIKDVRGSMAKRLPGPDVTEKQLRDRSWWKGPELFILVDDYDLVAQPGADNPLRPLAEFLPQAKDVGLHLIIARRSGGASRAIFDPVVGRLREIGAPGIVMSGTRDEGVLLGRVRATALPPGRGTLVSRKTGEKLVQIAWLPPDQDA
ncbi:type VII secretion protein EccCb [Actinokineospora sp. HUAS TT18]|uniref:type VII secretion protein EccCb n=1 Tax=Actinokineospora sp. HUAS TT18 TaxID=3447451 RepID=UPI003F51C799